MCDYYTVAGMVDAVQDARHICRFSQWHMQMPLPITASPRHHPVGCTPIDHNNSSPSGPWQQTRFGAVLIGGHVSSM
jgi:hypothetical protein